MSRRLVPSILLALACATLIGAAAPAAGALTRDAQMKQDVRLLKTYIDGYAAGRSFVFPSAAVVRKGGGLTAPVWPVNPWTNKPMAPGSARGTYSYEHGANGVSYALTGHLGPGSFTVTGSTPAWLTDERSVADAALSTTRNDQAELGARVIKGYIEQWGMLYNGTAPAAADVSSAGALGQMFSYWPTNPFNGRPMASSHDPGDFTYGRSDADLTSFYLASQRSNGPTTDLSGTVPQQLRTAMENLRSGLTNANIWKVQQAVDRYALDYSDTLPAHVDQATLGNYLDSWPLNPWFANTPMTDAKTMGNYSFTTTGPGAYAITAYVAGGAAGDVVNGDWRTTAMGLRDRLKNMYCQAAAQTLKEYVEQWKAGHAGTPPTVDEMTKTGAVGLVHAWWPTCPWTNFAMVNAEAKGEFQYDTGQANSYTLTVRQQPFATSQPPFTTYYTPQ